MSNPNTLQFSQKFALSYVTVATVTNINGTETSDGGICWRFWQMGDEPGSPGTVIDPLFLEQWAIAFPWVAFVLPKRGTVPQK